MGSKTTIALLWEPAVWVREMRERQATFPAVMNSGAVAKSDLYDGFAAGAGVSVNIPEFKDITDQDDEIQVEDTGPTDNGLTSGKMVAPILNRVCKTSATALSAAVSGSDPVGEITSRLVARRLKQRHKTALSILRGAFGVATGGAGDGPLTSLLVNAFDETGNDADSDQTMGVDLFIDAKSLLGELMEDLRNGAMLIHPTPLAALEKADVTAFKEKSMGAFTIRTYREIPIFVSESLARDGTTNGYVYETYLLASGVLAYGEAPQAGDTLDVASLQFDIDKDKNNGSIYDRTRFLFHPNGLKWQGTPGGQSATNAELETAANWALVNSTANRSGMVCIRTNA